MAKAKRIGRPPKPVKQRKSVNFTFRSRGEMREQLGRADEVSGRSISEEIERRLEASFHEERMARAVAKAILEYFGEQEVFKFAAKTIQGDQS